MERRDSGSRLFRLGLRMRAPAAAGWPHKRLRKIFCPPRAISPARTPRFWIIDPWALITAPAAAAAPLRTTSPKPTGTHQSTRKGLPPLGNRERTARLTSRVLPIPALIYLVGTPRPALLDGSIIAGCVVQHFRLTSAAVLVYAPGLSNLPPGDTV